MLTTSIRVARYPSIPLFNDAGSERLSRVVNPSAIPEASSRVVRKVRANCHPYWVSLSGAQEKSVDIRVVLLQEKIVVSVSPRLSVRLLAR